MKKDRNKDSIRIGEALGNYYKALGIDGKMNETAILAQWTDLVGEAVAKRTLSRSIREGILYIEVNSSVIRSELVQRKQEIITKVNGLAGQELIKDIFLK